MSIHFQFHHKIQLNLQNKNILGGRPTGINQFPWIVRYANFIFILKLPFKITFYYPFNSLVYDGQVKFGFKLSRVASQKAFSFHNFQFHCGGSLLTEDYVLTVKMKEIVRI